MRGHEPLIEMRRGRKRPTTVFLDVSPDESPTPRCRDWHLSKPWLPSVQIEPNDAPHRLDLRFVVGMTVIVSGRDAKRVHAVEEAAIEHRAQRVIASVVVPDSRANCGFVTAEVRDTAGVLSWQN